MFSVITGLAEISFMSKLLTIDIFETFSDQTGCPVSKINATNSPLLNGAIIVFSKATGEEVKRFFLFSDIVWKDQLISPSTISTENILLSAEIK